MQIYKVGGAVRDRLLGHPVPVKDRDWVVVGATPKQMLELGYRQVGKSFPVFLHPDTKEEYALARTERKTGPGYTGFSFHADPSVTLEEDLRRRDLTINAMAMDADDRLIDPFGGKRDLTAGVLRHVSPAFVEDPVRLLRVARFAARFGFQVADETRSLLRAMVTNGEVDALVPERVWVELEGALRTGQPARFFDVLRDCGALQRLFPEIDALFGVPQSAKSHPEVDTGLHVMMVLTQSTRLSADPRVRFAALTHDLGKARTSPDDLPRHPGHEEQSVSLVEALCRRLRIPNDYRELAVITARFHGRCHDALELDAEQLLDLLAGTDALRRPRRFEQFLLACEADSRGRLGYEDTPYPQAALCHAVRQAAASVDTRAFARSGSDGGNIQREVRRIRLEAVAGARDAFRRDGRE